MRITILQNEDTGIIEEVFYNLFEEIDFCDNTPEYIINSYFWIGIENEYDLDDFEFESKELEKRAYYPFSKQCLRDKIQDLTKGLEKYIKDFENFLEEWDELSEEEDKSE